MESKYSITIQCRNEKLKEKYICKYYPQYKEIEISVLCVKYKLFLKTI